MKHKINNLLKQKIADANEASARAIRARIAYTDAMQAYVETFDPYYAAKAALTKADKAAADAQDAFVTALNQFG